MNNQWIDIFRGGKQTDNKGRQHNGDELIEKALSSFDTNQDGVPVCVGHPRTDSPAFGWVESLRKTIHDGAAVLQAKFKKVAPEFEGWLKSGKYKNRSAAFYPDGKLRHIGFLGATPPAVKGLRPVQFSTSDDFIAFETPENDMALADWILDKQAMRAAEFSAGLTPEELAQARRIAGVASSVDFSNADEAAEFGAGLELAGYSEADFNTARRIAGLPEINFTKGEKQ